MKRWVTLIILYVLVHDIDKDRVISYEGLSTQSINDLLAKEGRTANFISEKEYIDFLRNHDIPMVIDPLKVQAKIDLNTQSKTPIERINAIIRYLDLDK
jgi:hypothetical protein